MTYLVQARFRVYGLVSPIFPPLSETFDLASVYSGGRTVLVSDQHFGMGSNLVLPGRGEHSYIPQSPSGLDLYRQGYG